MSNTETQKLSPITIGHLFGETTAEYVIPRYQRNYAWGKGEVTQLIEDVLDYTNKETHTPYYIGTLVVFERKLENKTVFETIDGQQRLTTLTIVLSAIHRLYHDVVKEKISLNLKLSFFSRPKSTSSLSVVTSNLNSPIYFSNNVEHNVNIKERYTDVETALLQKFGKEGEGINEFYNYLIRRVSLLRVAVPEKTDLNHYFEIMNNRGEQLEKHEVLKADLQNILSSDTEKISVFNQIWEAVADMERYVQYGFSTKERDCLFGNTGDEKWNSLEANSFEEISALLKKANASPDSDQEKQNTSQTFQGLSDIIAHQGDFGLNNDHHEDAPERFNSVINFPSFLLHVLKIQKQKDVPLDDKRLIESFKSNDFGLNTIEEVELFGFNLLKAKHLFDQYVIKREFLNNKDNWSLKKLKWYNGNKISYINSFGGDDDNESNTYLMMLLSMFHVSLPSMNYKHWLSASLNYLFKEEKFDSETYGTYLFQIAKSYFFDRVLVEDKSELDYYKMIFEGGYKNRKTLKSDLVWSNLDKGTSVENFAFNFTDYVLWLEEGKPKFEYTFRSSVEHYYPQNPINGEKLGDDTILNSFGNLCLISSSKNSKLSNYMPIAKKEHYDKVATDSLKQDNMMSVTSESKPWDVAQIKEHGKLIKNLLEEQYA